MTQPINKQAQSNHDDYIEVGGLKFPVTPTTYGDGTTSFYQVGNVVTCFINGKQHSARVKSVRCISVLPPQWEVELEELQPEAAE